MRRRALRTWPFAVAAGTLAAAFVLTYLFFVRTYVGQIVDERAFNGAAGVPMVIQNSGNNVLIQNATIVNVQFQP